MRKTKRSARNVLRSAASMTLALALMSTTVLADTAVEGTEPAAENQEALTAVSIGGISYYYTDTEGDAADTVYVATVSSRGGNTEYTFAKADMTQVTGTDYYYTTVNGTAGLDGTLYAYEGGTTTSYKDVYAEIGLEASEDPAYDAVSSATTYSSFHAKDISSIVNYGTDSDGNKAINGVNIGRTITTVDATTYVEANVLKAAGAELTEAQETAAALTLKQNPAEEANTETVTPQVASASWTTSRYGTGEFVINPDDTVEGYNWSEYWDNTYAVTISDGNTTVGAVHWIDVYGEKCTSGFHYNKLEIALNNGESVGANKAEVSRFAAFYDANTNNVKPGTYTITVYAEGYDPLVAEVTIPEEALQSASIGGITYYYADTTEDADNTVYTASVRNRGGSTVYNFTKADMTQVGETGYYCVTLPGVTALTGTVYAANADGKATTYKEVYTNLGVTVDDSYDAVSSATNYGSGHAKDISSVVTYSTDTDNNKTITGLSLGKSYTAVDAAAYVAAGILQAADEEITEEQAALAALTLKQNPTQLNEGTITPKAASATWTSSSYGTGEFVINPDDTVEGYNWNEYWDNTYAVTISDGNTTVGAVHWIDVYGEKSTSGFHYNKLEIALNNGTSVGKNAATVNRFAAFYDANTNNVKPGTYTITVYSDGYEPLVAEVEIPAEELDSTSIGGLTYFFTDTTDDADNTVYTATVAGRGGSTVYNFTKDDMTQVGETGYYYVTATNVTPLTGTLYAYEGGTATSYKDVYAKLGLEASEDPAYDAVSSATTYTSFHAKDISSVVNYGADEDGNKVINGVNLGRTITTVDAAAYVEANVLKAAGAELTEAQEATAALTLKQNPNEVANTETVTPEVASASWTTSRYGTGEFVINPDDTVEGYNWSEYWDNTYAVTISDGTTTVGAVHWIDVYGEKSTSGFHYNKLEIALNNGESVGANKAEVSRFAAFYDANTNNVKAGTYTITVYAEGYEPLVAEVTIPEEALQSASIGGLTYYYADTTDDADNIVYTATVAGRGGSTVYNFTKADMTQVGETNYYCVTLPGVTALTGTVYAVNEDGKATTYKDVYTNLGVTVDDSYDAVSSATNYTSFHAKDISSVVTYTTDTDNNKTITGLTLGRTYTAVDAAAYVAAGILQAAGEEITEEQEALAAMTLKQNPAEAKPETVSPKAAAATWQETSSYGVGEFVINPDETVEGYNWSEYWDNIYAVTISDGTTTVGAVHWIDVYGEKATSGFHYNKLEIALNNGTSVGKNAATVNRFAAFFNADNTLKNGLYTINVYADGYETMTATVQVGLLDPTITLKAKTATYTGKAIAINAATVKDSDGKVTYTYYTDSKCTKTVAASKVKNAGTYYVKATVAATETANAATSSAVKLIIKKAAQTIKVTAANKTVKLAKVKKKAQTVKAITKVTGAKGTLTYKKASGSAKITVNAKNGKVTVKKGTKKGKYSVKIIVTAKATANYNAKSVTKTVKITVK